MIFDREHECMSREDLRQLQGQRLGALVKMVYDRVPFYRDLLDKTGVAPEQVRGLDDLERLPMTRKYNLRDEYPFGLFARPLKEVVRIHASSGTTGKPTTVGYTRERHRHVGPGHGPLSGRAPAPPTTTSSKSPTATVSSRADWALTTARNCWAPP